MPAYSQEEKLRKDKIYQPTLKEEYLTKDKGEKKLLNNERKTVKLSNYFSSFTAGKISDWEGNKNIAFISSKRDFKHRVLSGDEKTLNLRRKSSLLPGSRTAYSNNVNKEKSALFLRERKKQSGAKLIAQYKELVEKSDNEALHKSIAFLSKESEQTELKTIRESRSAKNEQRIDYLRNVMNLKDQRALEFKNKLIKNQNAKEHSGNKRNFDFQAYRRLINSLFLQEKEKEDNENNKPTD